MDTRNTASKHKTETQPEPDSQTDTQTEEEKYTELINNRWSQAGPAKNNQEPQDYEQKTQVGNGEADCMASSVIKCQLQEW